MPFPHTWIGALVTTICLVLMPITVSADESLHTRVDALMPVTAIADDAEFLRRATLDLIGTIPTVEKTRAFLADQNRDKRATLITELLASPEHARHLSTVLDVRWMDRRSDNRVASAEWQKFLRVAVAENRPYDTIVREILLADGTDPKTRPAAKFMLDRDADSLQITRDVSRLFLGRDITCAQCHDHPVIQAYKQEHFFGIEAFLNRTFLFPDEKDKKATLAEKADGEVNFTSVFDASKVEKTTPPRLPTGDPLDEPMFEKGEEYEVAPDPKAKNKVRPIPKFSRRAQLGPVLTDSENRDFARTAVNQFWAMLMGRGLVHPIDQDHPGNPPSHPEVLDLLTDAFVAHELDVRWLLGELCQTKVYQRLSTPPNEGETVDPATFTVAMVRPLSPEQLAFSILQATGFADAERVSLGEKLTETSLNTSLSKQAASVIKTFAGPAGEPEGDFEATLEQTLFFKNGTQIRSWLAPRKGSLIDRVRQLDDPDTIIEELYLSILTRHPDADESNEMKQLLAEGNDLLPEIAWALIASAEFRFNH